MAAQWEIDNTYMGVALLHSKLSKARRSQVGACLVTIHDVLIAGVNGTPSGTDNNCEDEVNGILVTKSSTIHAELNCILKSAREGVSCLGATIYISLSPCLQCAAMLKQAGITRVVYKDTYRDLTGVQYLMDNQVKVEKFKE